MPLPFCLGMGLGGEVIHLPSQCNQKLPNLFSVLRSPISKTYFMACIPTSSAPDPVSFLLSSESKADRCSLYAGHSRIKCSSVSILFIWQKLHSRCSFGTLMYLPVSICSLWIDIFISRMAFLCFMFI